MGGGGTDQEEVGDGPKPKHVVCLPSRPRAGTDFRMLGSPRNVRVSREADSGEEAEAATIIHATGNGGPVVASIQRGDAAARPLAT